MIVCGGMVGEAELAGIIIDITGRNIPVGDQRYIGLAAEAGFRHIPPDGHGISFFDSLIQGFHENIQRHIVILLAVPPVVRHFIFHLLPERLLLIRENIHIIVGVDLQHVAEELFGRVGLSFPVKTFGRCSHIMVHDRPDGGQHLLFVPGIGSFYRFQVVIHFSVHITVVIKFPSTGQAIINLFWHGTVLFEDPAHGIAFGTFGEERVASLLNEPARFLHIFPVDREHLRDLDLLARQAVDIRLVHGGGGKAPAGTRIPLRNGREMPLLLIEVRIIGKLHPRLVHLKALVHFPGLLFFLHLPDIFQNKILVETGFILLKDSLVLRLSVCRKGKHGQCDDR